MHSLSYESMVRTVKVATAALEIALVNYGMNAGWSRDIASSIADVVLRSAVFPNALSSDFSLTTNLLDMYDTEMDKKRTSIAKSARIAAGREL